MTCYDEGLKRFLLLHLLFLLPVPGVSPGGRSNKAPVRMVGRLPRCGEGYSYFCAFMKCDVTLTYCFHYDQKSCVGVYPEFRVNFLDYDNPLLLKNVPFMCVVPGSALYVLSSVQVHVSMEGRKGSEHKLQGRSFDGELHLVHVRRDFWKPSTSKAGGRPSRVNLRSASQTPLGLAVNAIFLSVSDGERNEELDTFLSAYNIQIIQRSKEICPFEEICYFPRGKLPPMDGSDNDGWENALGNDDICSGPKMAEDEAVVALLQQKLKGGNPASLSRHFVLIAGNNQSSVNAIRDIINRLRKRRQRRHGKKVSKSRNKQVLCFCRQRRYMELYLLYAGRGEEVECRRTHYSRLPERTVEETNKKGQDSRAWFRMRPGRLLPRFSDYYQYFGSLTSPPCSEVVNWIVMKQPLRITTEQLTALHQLQSRQAGTPLRASGNVLPTLPLNGRLVTANGPSC